MTDRPRNVDISSACFFAGSAACSSDGSTTAAPLPLRSGPALSYVARDMTEPPPPSACDAPRRDAVPIRTWQLWIWPGLLVAFALGAWTLPWDEWVPVLRDRVAGAGASGAALYVAIYVVVVILPLPAAAMSVAGGLAFGWWGFPLAMLGSLLGCILPYWIGRRWLRAPLLARVSGRRLLAADRAIARNGLVFVALLRLTPILPFTAQNWILGLTAVGPGTYLLATTLGLAPGTLAMVWIGEMGGLASVGSDAARLWLAGGGLAAFGLLVVWLGRVATIEMRRAGFHDPARRRGGVGAEHSSEAGIAPTPDAKERE